MNNHITANHHNKFYGLDNLRAFAIIMVFLFHYPRWFEHPNWMPKVLNFGWTGVDLFFVLSGFLISSQLFAQIKKEATFSMKEFYIKRFFRILPVYYFVLAVYFLFPFFSEDQTLPPLWKFITFTQNFGADFANGRAFGVVWSLCVEEHFYLLMPVTLLLLLKTGLFKKGYQLIIFLFLLGLALRLYSWYYIYLPQTNGIPSRALWVSIIYYPTYCRLDGLLAGVSIAALYNYLPAFFARITKYANYIIAVGVMLFIIGYYLCLNALGFNRSIIGFPLISIAFGCMVMGAVMPGSFLYRWKSKVMTKIAELSYSLYLVHMGVILLTQTVFSKWGIAKNSTWMLLLSIVVCIGISLLLHYGIEKPFMKMRNKFLKSQVPKGKMHIAFSAAKSE